MSQGTNNSTLHYRADIDGLRAIAVLSVIVFHINPAHLSGGFLGVDMFFVLSGFLITSLLVKDVKKHGRLELVGFYVRRIRRIFPALMFLVLCVITVGYMVLAPPDFSDLSMSSIWGLLSVANIYYFLFLDEGYFAADSAEQPLLHLWSLGVEEQFYLIWPFYIFLLVRAPMSSQGRMWITFGVIIVSLAMAQLLIDSQHSFAYYMLPTRAWELAAGGVLVFGALHSSKLNQWMCEWIAFVGLGLILFSLVYVSKEHDAPGIAAIPVVLGTAMLIYSGLHQQTLVKTVLSTRILVLIGLVSYSAYLWHWPIIAFLKYSLIEVKGVIALAVIVATFIFATLSYHLVEKPLRYYQTSNRNVFVGYFLMPVLGMSILCAGALIGIRVQSDWLYDWSKYEVITQTRPASKYEYNCQQTTFDAALFKSQKCVHPPQAEPSVLLVGDSMAAQYLGIFREMATHYQFALRNLTQSSCSLITAPTDFQWIERKYREGCQSYVSFLRQHLANFDTLVIGGSWPIYERKAGPHFRSLMQQTIESLAQKINNIILMGKNPNFSGFQVSCEQRQVKLGFIKCDAARFNRPQPSIPANEFLQQLADKYDNVHYYDVAEHLCADGTCSPFLSGHALYYDSMHLSMEGSAYLGTQMITSGSELMTILDPIFQSN